MKFEKADDLKCNLHERQIEISLNDVSCLPKGAENPKNRCVMTEEYLKYAERIHNFTVRPDDVWIITFPKCGTTWTQEMVWLIDHDLDFEAANAKDVLDRSAFLEISAVAPAVVKVDTVEIIDKLPGRRHIKSHLPLAMLPKQLWTVKPKIVYCTRNALDVAVSYMHHYRAMHGFLGSNDTFLKGLLEDQVLWCPQVQHTLDFYQYYQLASHGGFRTAGTGNFIFIHYEEMQKDLMSVLKRVCKFFDKTFTDEQLAPLIKHLSFESMKANPRTNHAGLVEQLLEYHRKCAEKAKFQFMRKGKVGSYSEELDENYIQRFRAHVDKQLVGSSFKYIYKI